MGVRLLGDGAACALNQLAREQMKMELLKDILRDALVCSIEGWPHLDYLDELAALVNERVAVARSKVSA